MSVPQKSMLSNRAWILKEFTQILANVLSEQLTVVQGECC